MIVIVSDFIASDLFAFVILVVPELTLIRTCRRVGRVTVDPHVVPLVQLHMILNR
jgi:hypothetical protein